MKKEMLINVLQPEECRIAILEDGVLEELYVERTSHESYVGNIYKGRIVNIEPSIQAAFVDFGVGRNGFLHVSDVEPAYYRHLEGGGGGGGGRRGDRGDRDRGDRGERGGRFGGGAGGRDQGRPRPRFEEEELPREFEFSDTGSEQPSAAEYAEEQIEVHVEEELFEAVPPPPPAAPAVADLYPEVTPVDDPADDEEPRSKHSGTTEESGKSDSDAPAEPATPLVALPETVPEEETTGTRRRRSRGGSRRRRSPAEAREAEGEAAKPDASGDNPPEKPPLMESAEHRTSGNDSKSGSEDDDLLFFPSSSPAAAARPAPPPPPPPPEPDPEPRPRAEERAPVFTPPARPRPPRSRGNIEDDLAADLAALDLGDDVEVPEAPPVAEFEPEERDEEAAPAPREFEEERPPRREFRDEDDEFAPPPRMPRGDDRRGPPRDGGRGGRDRDGGRGGRDNGPRGRTGRDSRDRRGGRPGATRPKPLIQDIFRRGQEVLVQVIKEGIGTKGPTLSTYISIPGRYLVVMPHLNRVGVSRKIEDEEQRRRLREIFNELKPPRGLGFIMRTAAIDKNKKELQRDLAYLSRIWQVVVRRIRKLKAPAEIYQESDMITRTIRDTFTSDIDSIVVDEPAAYEHAKEFLEIVMPRFADRIRLYDGKDPLFHRSGLEDEIARIQMRKIPLPHGGSIVIEQTEALVAIDVNSGNFRADNNAEETAFQMNLQAAKEIARQLRLRDLGGVIVNDFIDMRDDKHRRAVEKAMRDAVRRDRARTKILKISAFGLIEMTRQRIRPSLKRSVYQDCQYCKGMAQVKTCESMSIEVMRMLQLAAHREHVHRVEVRVAEDVADYLLNRKRREISKLEEGGEITVLVKGTPGKPPELLEFICLDNNGNEVKVFASAEPPPPRHRR
jgi:ribonuclease E